jgi:hypothetical protein
VSDVPPSAPAEPTELFSAEDLRDVLEEALRPHGFLRAEARGEQGVTVLGAWVRKTWNTNRGVVLLRRRRGADPAQVAKDARKWLAPQLGYLWFLYGIGLQVVFYDPTGEPPGDLAAGVDKVDNQWCIVQSLFCIDARTGKVEQARTWGQVITGQYQDAIAAALAKLAPIAPAPVDGSPAPDARG